MAATVGLTKAQHHIYFRPCQKEGYRGEPGVQAMLVAAARPLMLAQWIEPVGWKITVANWTGLVEQTSAELMRLLESS